MKPPLRIANGPSWIYLACFGRWGNTAWGTPTIRWGLVEESLCPVLGLPRGVRTYSTLNAYLLLDESGAVCGGETGNLGTMAAMARAMQRLLSQGGADPRFLPLGCYGSLGPHLQLVQSDLVTGFVDHRDLPRLRGLQRYVLMQTPLPGESASPTPIIDAVARHEAAASDLFKAHFTTPDGGIPRSSDYSSSSAAAIGSWLAGRTGAAHIVLRPQGPDPTWGLSAAA